MSGGTPKRRLGDRLLALLGVRLVVWLIAANAFLPGVLLDPVDKVGYYHDEHGDIMGEESARRSYVEHHQLPAWDPYWCGGVVGLSNAGSLTLAPDFLLRIAYGTLAGRRLAILLFVVLGMEGTFRYARHNGASALGAAMGAVAFSTNGGFVGMLRLGWGFMFQFNLVPWVLLSYEKGLRSRWWIVAGGFFVVWLLLGAGTYALPYTIFVLGLLMVFETVRAVFGLDGADSVKWWRPLATFCGIGLTSVGMGAIRLLPLLGLLSTHTRLVMQKDQTAPLSVLSMLALPAERGAWGAGAGEHYVGVFVFLLGVAALLFADRRAAKFWVLALFFGVLACGEFVDGAPYELMRKLPIYSQLRFPIRMLTLVALFVALAGAFGLTRIEDLLPEVARRAWERLRGWRSSLAERLPLPVSVGVALLSTALAARVAYAAAKDVYEHTAVAKGSIYNVDGPQLYRDEFRQSRGNRWDAHVWPFASRGTLHCFDENELFESPYLRGDLPQEEYGAPETDTVVQRISWSPHQIVVRVKSSGPGRFLVNQNHAAPWKTDVGELGADGGLISVRVPPGEHVVTLTYSDWRIRLGALITFATFLAIAIRGGRRLRDRLAALTRWYGALPEDGASALAGGTTVASTAAALVAKGEGTAKAEGPESGGAAKADGSAKAQPAHDADRGREQPEEES